MDRMKDRLDALWVEYREATPDPEAGPNFMPQLWQKIEARRVETTSVFRRLAQICVMATIALALVISAVLIPHSNNDEAFYSGTYVDVLAAEHSNDYVEALPAGDYPMNFSRKTIALYVGLVFVSGAVLGVFGDRLYTVTTVASKGKNAPS